MVQWTATCLLAPAEVRPLPEGTLLVDCWARRALLDDGSPELTSFLFGL